MFRFKQFSIVQEKSAMKVGTDGVLLGAWAAMEHPQNILDIGSGTGLVSLMLAQRFPKARIHGIEIEENAFLESQLNVENSPFAQRCHVEWTSLQDFESNQSFDLIVSNPPFFDWTHSDKTSRNLARQQSDLTFEELLFYSKKWMNEHAKLAYVIPYLTESKMLTIAESLDLYPEKITRVKGHAQADFKRSLLLLGQEKVASQVDELTIELERHVYSEAYIELTKAFYLKM
ncbi:MAG TPA: methyltransferase [Moheibacter sp.]|nr:methyltransferase [Moheibacter sp.]